MSEVVNLMGVEKKWSEKRKKDEMEEAITMMEYIK